jgi:hypothetical protein
MRTVTFKSIFERVVMLKGYQPTTLDLSDSQALNLAKYIEAWCRKGWEYAAWPEWLHIEERTPSSNIVALHQQGSTHIGEVLGVYPSAKKARQDWDGFEYALTKDGIDLTDATGVGSTVWVKFRKVAPQFTTEAWDAANAAYYTEGYVVYYPTTSSGQLMGNCYMADLTAAGAQTWVLQEMPMILKDYVTWGAFSECLRQDGQGDRANEEAAKAETELARLYLATFGTEGNMGTVRLSGRELPA